MLIVPVFLPYKLCIFYNFLSRVFTSCRYWTFWGMVDIMAGSYSLRLRADFEKSGSTCYVRSENEARVHRFGYIQTNLPKSNSALLHYVLTPYLKMAYWLACGQIPPLSSSPMSLHIKSFGLLDNIGTCNWPCDFSCCCFGPTCPSPSESFTLAVQGY